MQMPRAPAVERKKKAIPGAFLKEAVSSLSGVPDTTTCVGWACCATPPCSAPSASIALGRTSSTLAPAGTGSTAIWMPGAPGTGAGVCASTVPLAPAASAAIVPIHRIVSPPSDQTRARARAGSNPAQDHRRES
ncbi:hypothetical protein DVW87_01500 [Sphingomonas aracearum]|uniref:Uncharacterized protein n=1 Tax=Sphingomonas aracearum TaxID=2283317 RepID=A0A369VVK5_9SPHN|nr:hypothetical protein DVW87_01500 [Sphingomonas aracearum]